MTSRARKQATSADAAPEYRSNPELALAALICLMSRFPARRSPVVAAAIVAHLRFISEDVRLSHRVRHCADSLIDDWAAYAMLCAPEATDAQQPS